MIKYLIILFCFCLFSCQKEKKYTPIPITKKNIKKNINPKIKLEVSKRTLRRISRYKSIIKKYSELYRFDWRLILAIILRESRFREKAISHVGAKGLMQIMPRNEKYLKNVLDVDFIYERPEENIRAGIFHLREQINYFSEITDKEKQLKVALASYNSGVGRMRDVISIAKYKNKLFDYDWVDIKAALKLLSRKNYELHLDIWKNGKPKYGYFVNYNETINYVENIFNYYKSFKLKYNAK